MVRAVLEDQLCSNCCPYLLVGLRDRVPVQNSVPEQTDRQTDILDPEANTRTSIRRSAQKMYLNASTPITSSRFAAAVDERVSVP